MKTKYFFIEKENKCICINNTDDSDIFVISKDEKFELKYDNCCFHEAMLDDKYSEDDKEL